MLKRLYYSILIFFVLSLPLQGQVVFEQVYETGRDTSWTNEDAIELEDGRVLLLSTLRAFNPNISWTPIEGSPTIGIALQLIDQNGTVLEKQIFESPTYSWAGILGKGRSPVFNFYLDQKWQPLFILIILCRII